MVGWIGCMYGSIDELLVGFCMDVWIKVLMNEWLDVLDGFGGWMIIEWTDG